MLCFCEPKATPAPYPYQTPVFLARKKTAPTAVLTHYPWVILTSFANVTIATCSDGAEVAALINCLFTASWTLCIKVDTCIGGSAS